MDTNFFEKRLGSSLSDCTHYYALQMFDPCVVFACAYVIRRKVVVQPRYWTLSRYLISCINQFSSHKFSGLYRHEIKEYSNLPLHDHAKNYFNDLKSSNFRLGLFLINILSEANIYDLAAQAAWELTKPVYVLWRDPIKDGEYANYTPPSSDELWAATEKIGASTLSNDCPLILSFLLLKTFPTLYLNQYVTKELKQNPKQPLKEKVKKAPEDIQATYKYLVGEQTLGAWAMDQVGVLLGEAWEDKV